MRMIVVLAPKIMKSNPNLLTTIMSLIMRIIPQLLGDNSSEGDYAVKEFSVQQRVMHFLHNRFGNSNIKKMYKYVYSSKPGHQCLMRKQKAKTLILHY